MTKIVLNIKDKSKERTFVDFLKELSFLEIQESEKTRKGGECADFRKLFGIWKNREISLTEIREQAWAKRTL